MMNVDDEWLSFGIRHSVIRHFQRSGSDQRKCLGYSSVPYPIPIVLRSSCGPSLGTLASEVIVKYVPPSAPRRPKIRPMPGTLNGNSYVTLALISESQCAGGPSIVTVICRVA